MERTPRCESLSRPPAKEGNGFTLVEALLSILVLAFMASVVTALYGAGIQALDAQADQAVLDSHLRSKMEELISTTFDELATGSDTVVVNGKEYTRSWQVTGADLDGDATPESAARQVTVDLAGHSLTTIVVDNEGRIGKL